MELSFHFDLKCREVVHVKIMISCVVVSQFLEQSGSEVYAQKRVLVTPLKLLSFIPYPPYLLRISYNFFHSTYI